MRKRLTFAGAFVSLLVGLACDREQQPVRPSNVPANATYIPGGKVGGWWQECELPETATAAHCRIWNAGGLALYDEEFLPYDEGAVPSAGELKIAPDPVFPGPDRIFLTNGRVLLPKSRFADLKKFVDWLKGKRKTAN